MAGGGRTGIKIKWRERKVRDVGGGKEATKTQECPVLKRWEENAEVVFHSERYQIYTYVK